jgi:hypothetical protein
MSLNKTAQSKKLTKSHNYENCVTAELQGQKMSAKQALRKVKAFEDAHQYETIIVDRKTTILKLIR